MRMESAAACSSRPARCNSVIFSGGLLEPLTNEELPNSSPGQKQHGWVVPERAERSAYGQPVWTLIWNKRLPILDKLPLKMI
jgi:hypothetical protein